MPLTEPTIPLDQRATGGPAPLVSVIMPAWNAFPWIEEAVASVLTQSFRDLELIVVNDGSTDGDYRQFERRDPRVRVIEGERGGVSRARNLAMAAARGRYFAFIDADDVWVPGKLDAQVRFLEANPDIDVAYGEIARWACLPDGTYPPASSYFPSLPAVYEVDPARRGWGYTRILMGSPLGMITPVMRRSLYEKVGEFDVRLSRGEDYDFWLRCSREGRLQRFRAVLALYRMRPTSAMHQMVKDNPLVQVLESARERFGLADPDGRAVTPAQFRRRLGRCHFDHGYNHFWSGDPGVAHRAFGRALLHRYRPARSLVYWVLSGFKRLRHGGPHGG